MSFSQEYGIMKNDLSKNLFKQINDEYRLETSKTCADCREQRKRFKSLDKKNKHSSFSNLLPGFSSEQIEIPVDILIVGEAHGGGRENDFHKQLEIEEEVAYIGSYYLYDAIVKFHQYQIRELLHRLDELSKMWVFTDLLKCYVANDRENRKIAIKHCEKHLISQIELLQPRVILALGKTVGTYFKLRQFDHSKLYDIDGKKILYSIFPGRNTSDLWVANGQWEPILREIEVN
ncbi:hypothetical protein ES703_03038 [subsurface metagenome]